LAGGWGWWLVVEEAQPQVVAPVEKFSP